MIWFKRIIWPVLIVLSIAGVAVAQGMGGEATQSLAALLRNGTKSMTGNLHLNDDVPLELGNTSADPDYWAIYDSTNTQWELNSTNCDGAGADCVALLLNDGTDDFTFSGDIAGANANGPLIENTASSATNGTLCPDKASPTACVGGTGGALSLITGGVERLSISSSGAITVPVTVASFTMNGTSSTGGGTTLNLGGPLSYSNPTTGATCADSGGAGAAACTLTSSDTRFVQHLTCSDADGCNFTLDETTATAGILIVVNTGNTNACNFLDSAGVQETASPALGQWDSVTFSHTGTTWVQLSPVQNN